MKTDVLKDLSFFFRVEKGQRKNLLLVFFNNACLFVVMIAINRSNKSCDVKGSFDTKQPLL